MKMKATMARVGGRDKCISCSSKVQDEDESNDGKGGRERRPSCSSKVQDEDESNDGKGGRKRQMHLLL